MHPTVRSDPIPFRPISSCPIPQIEMRVCGLGWSDLATTWQKQGESLAASVGRLKGHLKDVLIEEAVRTRRGELVWSPDGVLLKPEEAALPDFKAKTLKQLGTRTHDAGELAARALCSPEQVAAASRRERERREEAGFTDAVQVSQPKAPTMTNSLVGARVEICWGNYISTVDNKTKVSPLPASNTRPSHPTPPSPTPPCPTRSCQLPNPTIHPTRTGQDVVPSESCPDR